MDALTALETRRSIKLFDPQHTLSEAEERRLLELAKLSPTAFNLQHWRFVLVKDPALRQQLRALAWNQAQVTDASLLVVVCADLKAWQRYPERCWSHAPEQVQQPLLKAIDGFYRENEALQRDEALRSCGIAAQSLMIAAKAMGYDSCPMDGFDFDAVGEAINLPDDHIVTLFVAIGKAVEPARPRGGLLDYEDVVIIDRFYP
ncbi:nitroreductase [Magnetococcus marinus MC-1]|uniref:Nitroreductase n=1 Tax=Magnetococcus marinus (strain ATCC BAA-1437 / JCM 17883 / MC-1) TaxID=156889 RepID=A0L6D1_MAGMM|nr:nitroreductase family protein [Magnetococcus marinus]ABK43524.1 nitroreductase [Magnetococcus marinus MC-1]